MDQAAFSDWLSRIGRLSAVQRQRVIEELSRTGMNEAGPALQIAAPDAGEPGAVQASDAACDEPLLKRIGLGRIASAGCPHCGGDEICRWGHASGKPRYRCAGCRKTFNAVTGTPLAGLHYPERWNLQGQALNDGDTVAKAAKRCEVDYTTAFRWRHRFLSALNSDKPASLEGIVEADETFILESFKGRRSDLPRAAHKRGGQARTRGLSAEQIPVLVARDRTGATTDAVLSRLDTASVTAALGGVIKRDATLCSDGGKAITAFARRARLVHHVLPAPGAPLPDAPSLHINNVNAYHGRLKEWMRRFHGVATKNLPSYLSWRRTIEAFSTASKPEAWVMGSAGLGPYQQASQ